MLMIFYNKLGSEKWEVEINFIYDKNIIKLIYIGLK